MLEGKEKAGYNCPEIFRKQQCPRECEERGERPQKKQKPQEASQEMELKTHLSPFPNPRKRNLKEELVSSDLEEIAGTGSLSKMKKTFSKEEPVSDPKELGNKRVPKEERTGKLPAKEEALSSGPEEAAASKSSGSKKNKKFQNYPRKIRMDISLVGRNLLRYSPIKRKNPPAKCRGPGLDP